MKEIIAIIEQTASPDCFHVCAAHSILSARSSLLTFEKQIPPIYFVSRTHKAFINLIDLIDSIQAWRCNCETSSNLRFLKHRVWGLLVLRVINPCTEVFHYHLNKCPLRHAFSLRFQLLLQRSLPFSTYKNNCRLSAPQTHLW